MVSRMAGSHIDLRKRNAAFNARVGKVNKLKTQDPLDKKPVPRWLAVVFLVLIAGGLGLELLNQIVSYFTAARAPTR
ncbi:hypothetical protein DMC30DRAFT_413078 [Rhodotorula diobovata]|uniref:Uncharacterized protein n=1 Tax=Rhodotorula diobovata TaxID=5288 RepID=A0A5C5G5S4_9BASI|nr:hypothetical protein DMC30DRAFT_413078 [Rhodotorula diobovata]